MICFKNVTFEEIITKFKSVYDINIFLNNYETNKYSKISGKFRTIDGVDDALRTLREVIPFTYNIQKKEKREKINIYFNPN